MKVLQLIKNYQANGYLIADIDPLKLLNNDLNPNMTKIYRNTSTLDYKYYGFDEKDLEREFTIYTDKIKVNNESYLRGFYLNLSL